MARGKMKLEEAKLAVGDDVEFEITEDNQAVITKILERKNFLKRPKVSNISQIIFVVSAKMPKTNFLNLDKLLAFAEFLGIKSVIVINKKDLDKVEAHKIASIYSKVGYRVIQTNAENGDGIEEIKKILKSNTSVLSRKFRSAESQL